MQAFGPHNTLCLKLRVKILRQQVGSVAYQLGIDSIPSRSLQ
jgi:hypothetical protein